METTNIHASCVELGGAGTPFGVSGGVLLLGPSGSGKSDLALRLIERGARLVSDDRTELFVHGKKLHARAPERLAGLMEIRGVGIVTLPHEKDAQLLLAIELVAAKAVPRLPLPRRFHPPAPIALPDAALPPLLQLTAFEPAAAAKVIAAAAAFAQNLFREEVKKI